MVFVVCKMLLISFVEDIHNYWFCYLVTPDLQQDRLWTFPCKD
jgi:hypothetical protein